MWSFVANVALYHDQYLYDASLRYFLLAAAFKKS
jgi:hypothetical protein